MKMNIEVVKSKIHKVTVTEANLQYVGSISIDEDLLDAADIIENEKVQVVNLNNGRVETNSERWNLHVRCVQYGEKYKKDLVDKKEAEKLKQIVEKKEKDLLAQKHGFENYPDGTFMDFQTGLIWQDNNATKNSRIPLGSAIDYCEKLKLSGLTSWRLATTNELKDLYTKTEKLKYLDNSSYWSSSPHKDSYKGLYVTFYNGNIGSQGKRFYHNVRCVRDTGTKLKERIEKLTKEKKAESLLLEKFGLSSYPKNVFIDSETELMWEWGKVPIEKKWLTAKTYCENLKHSSLIEWRLPTKNELKNFRDNLDGKYMNSYWSSTTSKSSKDRAYCVNFMYNNIHERKKKNYNYVICVKDRQ